MWMRRIRSLYRLAVPVAVRDFLYLLRDRETRTERAWAKECRKAIRSYLTLAASEQWLTGRVVEIGAGRDTFARDTFLRYAPAVRFLRTDISTGSYGLAGASHELDFLCDVRQQGIATASVDGIICSEVLEHVFEHDAAVRELARVLRPGGTLILTSPFIYPLHGPDCWRFTPDTLRRLLERDFIVLDVSLAPLQRDFLRFPVNIGVRAERRQSTQNEAMDRHGLTV